MFLRLASQIGERDEGAPPQLADINALFARHPNELLRYLEDAWESGAMPDEAGFRAMARRMEGHEAGGGDEPRFGNRADAIWPHLVYAYLLENTRLVDI